MTVTSVSLPIDQPLDLTTTLSSGQSFRWQRDDENWWVGVLGGEIVRLFQQGSDLLVQSIANGRISSQVLNYLRMDDDLTAIQARLSKDHELAPCILAYPGLRVLRQDPWETLVAFILSATSNIPRISRTIEAIAKKFGYEVSMDGLVRHTFPSPEQFGQIGETDLRELGCGFRAPYVVNAAKAIASGDLKLNELKGRPYAEIEKTLTALQGVGTKIADCVMLFSLDQTEAFPIDRWVWRALSQRYEHLNFKRYVDARVWAQAKFGVDAGYANQYLFWNSRENKY